MALNVLSIARCWCKPMSCSKQSSCGCSKPCSHHNSMLSACTMGYKRKIAITALSLALTFSEDVVKAFNDRSYKRASAPIPSATLPIAKRVLPADTACISSDCISDAAPLLQHNCVVNGDLIDTNNLLLRIGKQAKHVCCNVYAIRYAAYRLQIAEATRWCLIKKDFACHNVGASFCTFLRHNLHALDEYYKL
jgi:hypothetical protein